jgi:hypothetical protein
MMDVKAIKKKGHVPAMKIPKQKKLEDRGYEVFTQEANRSSTPGGSRQKISSGCSASRGEQGKNVNADQG